jgi:hypothetical protein
LEYIVRVRFLAPLFLLSLAAQGCFQTNCPETKTRLLNRFDPASPTFDPDLLSPAPLGQEGNIQAILETNPSRCVDLSDPFRLSAIEGVSGDACVNIGAPCEAADTCRRTTESTATIDVLECRQNCVDADDTTCPVGTACIQADDDQDGDITNDDFRCDNPNLGLCQGILRELGQERCVACDELELFTCECRTGASGFACLAGIVDREQIVKVEALNICGRSFPDEGQAEDLQACIDDITEPNSREERLACTGINDNISVLGDGVTTDCSRNAFLLESGQLCGNGQECLGGRCDFLSTNEFDGTTPLDPIETKVCSSDCGDDLDDNDATPKTANPARCELGFFCSDNIRNLDGSLQEPGCMPVENINTGFSADFDSPCDIADPNSCQTGSCKILANANNIANCTIPCTEDEQCGNGSTCIDTNPASAFKFCAAR